jgi:hypothetical protein
LAKGSWQKTIGSWQFAKNKISNKISKNIIGGFANCTLQIAN